MGLIEFQRRHFWPVGENFHQSAHSTAAQHTTAVQVEWVRFCTWWAWITLCAVSGCLHCGRVLCYCCVCRLVEFSLRRPLQFSSYQPNFVPVVRERRLWIKLTRHVHRHFGCFNNLTRSLHVYLSIACVQSPRHNSYFGASISMLTSFLCLSMSNTVCLSLPSGWTHPKNMS